MAEGESRETEEQEIIEIIDTVPMDLAVFAWEQFLKRVGNNQEENTAKQLLLKELKGYANLKRQNGHKLALQSKKLEDDLKLYLNGKLKPENAVSILSQYIKKRETVRNITPEQGENDIELLDKIIFIVKQRISAVNRYFNDYLKEDDRAKFGQRLIQINDKFKRCCQENQKLKQCEGKLEKTYIEKAKIEINKVILIDREINILAREMNFDLNSTEI